MLLSVLFCGTVFADTITINWGIDNQPYTTTTCEVGNDVFLPTAPTKRGHIFRGWTPEHFDRGTFSNWSNVPTNENGYSNDFYNNTSPKQGDYIIVSDVSLYPVDPVVVTKESSNSGGGAYNIPITCTVNGTDTTILYSRDSEVEICGGKIKIRCFNSNSFSFYANTDLYYNGTLLHRGDLIRDVHWMYYLKIYTSLTQISGTWRFVYDGVWETDGKNGWKPAEQIISE